MTTKQPSHKKEIKKQIRTLCQSFNPRVATTTEWFAFEDKLNPLLDQLLYEDIKNKTHLPASKKPAGTCAGADSNKEYGHHATYTRHQTGSYARLWVSPLTEMYAYSVKRSEPKPKSLRQQEQSARSYHTGSSYVEREERMSKSDSIDHF